MEAGDESGRAREAARADDDDDDDEAAAAEVDEGSCEAEAEAAPVALAAPASSMRCSHRAASESLCAARVRHTTSVHT